MPPIHPLWVFVPDLLLNSRIAALAGGIHHPVWKFGRASQIVEALEVTAELITATRPDMVPSVVIADLNAPGGEAFEILESVRSLRAGGRFTPRVLAFYAHVDAELRERAQALGADRIVPRSALVNRFAHWIEELTARADVP